MKTKFLKMLLCTGVISCFALVSFGQVITTRNVGVKARLAGQLLVSKIRDVDFGGIFVPKTDVVATMSYRGTVSITTGSALLYSTFLQQAGYLRIDTKRPVNYTVQYPSNVTLFNGSNTLAYTPILYTPRGVVIPSSSSTFYYINVDEIGDAQENSYNTKIIVAGTLAIAKFSASGTYTGIVPVSIVWQ